MIKNRERTVALWKQLMLPLVFTLPSLLNVAFFYLGLAFRENVAREYGFILGNAVFAVATGLTLLQLWRKARFPWHNWLLWGGTVVFFGVAFAYAVLRHGLHYLIFDYLLKFILFCLPALFVGIIGAKWRTDQNFVAILEKISFFVLPAALVYFMQVMFNANPFNYGRDLGMIGYMSFAYTLMPFLMALVIRFADGEELVIPILNRKVQHPRLARLGMILVFWVALYATGTRGAMICVLCFLAFLVLFKLLRKEKAKPALLVSGIMVAVLVFNLFIFAPTGMRWLGRMDMFLNGLLSGEIVTSPESGDIGENLDDYINLHPGDPGYSDETGIGDHGITSRGTLFKLAIGEFLNAPLLGIGPGEFSVKYNMFPHNVILELLAETGVIGAVLLLSVVVYALVKLFKASLKDKKVLYVFLFFLTYAVQANCNGTVWYCSALLCAIGYGVTFRLGSGGEKNEQ